MKKIHRRDEDGSITVYLSLILLLILSLVMTVIEGARITTARIFAERSLMAAMDSVLAEFYGPLMEEYHILGLDAGYGSNTVKEEEIALRLQDYMSYTITPNRDISDRKASLELYDISVDSLSITDRTELMDYRGEVLINEAVEYMKYRELGNGMELLLDKMSLLEEPKKVSVLYEEKLKVEEELVAIDEGILNLMFLLDGVATNEKGLITDNSGGPLTMDNFAKRICFGTATEEKVGINNNILFMALRDKYVDPSIGFASLEEAFDRLDQLQLKISDLEIERNQIITLIRDASNTLSSLNASRKDIKIEDLKTEIEDLKAKIEDIKAIDSQITSCAEYISGLEGQKSEIEVSWTNCEQEKAACLEEISNQQSRLNLLIDPLVSILYEAERTIDTIMETAMKADPLIDNYEESLALQGVELGEEIYESLKEGVQELKRYRTDNDTGYNFPLMKEIINKDYNLIFSVQGLLIEGVQSFAASDYMKARECLGKAEGLLTSYQTEGLKLDYSTIVFTKKDDLNPLGMVKSLIEGGLVGLVIDPASISEAELSEALLPSDIAALAALEDEGEFDFASFFEKLVIGGKKAGMGGLFNSFGDYDISALLGDGLNILAEHLLFQAYLQEHFYSLPMEGENISARKPSVLSYEKEYLLIGSNSDRDNLVSIITRLIFLRTILDFTSILGDKDKWKEAKVTATALVGFTGLPILVSITQTVLMVLLAFAEALVDTSALLMGREVQLLKKKVNLGFYDLLNLSREEIQTKASLYPEKASGLSLTYQDYLKVFLFIKKKEDVSYLAMDLIQENLRIRYEDNFCFENCLYGFEAEAEFIIKEKFTALSFVKQHLSGQYGYQHGVHVAYSY
ncbi:MAG TPA: DUF5702 domain-containing protein [Mobilitalea sp.]|nr:DUF5702 domain-containing protein [Mobilitalea sp.]